MKIQDRFGEEEKTQELGTVTVKNDGENTDRKQIFLREHELTIMINETEAVRLVCTASDLVNLVAGRLISEGFAESIEDFESIYICDTGHRARVFLKAEVSKETVPEVPTCCTDNTNLVKPARSLKEIGTSVKVKPVDIFGLVESFVTDGNLHRGTGSTHSAYLMCGGETVYGCEDIGRHNALDKAIGEIFIKGYAPQECLIFTTGRIPTDMVKKAVRAGIGGLVSKSVPTAQALELAEQYGLNLYFKAWPDSYEMLNGTSPE